MSHQRKLSRSQRSKKHRAKAKRMLKEAIRRTSDPFDGEGALKFQLLRLFELPQRLHEGIDAAFGYQLFIPGLPPQHWPTSNESRS